MQDNHPYKSANSFLAPLTWRLALRNVLRNPRRSLLTLGAIVVGLWSSLTLSSVARGVSQGLLENTVRNLTAHIQIHDPQYLNDPSLQHSMEDSDITPILRSLNSSTTLWSKRVRVPAVIMSERDSYPLQLIGIDPAMERQISFVGDGVSAGHELSAADDNGIVIGKKMLQLLRTELGKRIVVMSQSESGEIVDKGFKVIGVFDAELETMERAYAFTGIKTMQSMLGSPSKISEVAILLKDKEDPVTLAEELAKQYPRLSIKDWAALEPFATSIRGIQNKFLVFWFLIVVIAISVGLINTLFMALFERTREIGLMQALGMRSGMVLAQVLSESALILFGGAALANLSALFSVWYLSSGIDLSRFAAGASFVGIRELIIPQILPRDWIIGNLLVMLIGLIGSIYPAWRGTKIIPAKALQRG